MRNILIFFWLLVPLGLAAFHYGPGQEKLKVDAGGAALTEARTLFADGNFSAAADAFEEAIKSLPDSESETITIARIEKAKAMMACAGLVEAHDDLVTLLDDLTEQKDTPPELIAETKSTLASAKYYRTWLMRLEGHPREVWEPEIEASRQYYTSAAEFATSDGSEKEATAAREDLEAAIKLARIDLSELQGLPLPNQ